MSRIATRVSQRAAGERNDERWTSDVARYWAAEAERERVAARMAELSARLRGGAYEGREADAAELDQLWSRVR